MSEIDVFLEGPLPEPPVVLCKDSQARMLVMRNIHKDWAKRPSVVVAESWPEDWHINIVVVMPMRVLGTERTTSFSIVGDHEISETARTVLDAYIAECRSRASVDVSYRDLSEGTGLDRRTVGAAVRELADAGIGTYKYKAGFHMDIGTWRLDAYKAKAFGIEIREF